MAHQCVFMRKPLLLLFLLALLPLTAMAYDVKINGIYYNLVEKVKIAEVTQHPNQYTGDIVIPEKVDYNGTSFAVTSIGSSAFYGCTGLTSVTIPSSVTSIGSSAFDGCRGLTSVTIPSSVTSIGSSAFWGCGRLTSVTIPNSVTSIGNTAFSNCSGLTSIVIPSSVTSIDYGTFYGCSGLTAVTIPSSVTSIGNTAFSNCSGLTSIVIPSSVTGIGNNAFEGCSSLTSVTIPSSVTSIGNSAFANCSGLTSVVIPSSVTSIGDYAFYGCSGLTSVTIPSSVMSIDLRAFEGCSGLTSVTIGSGVGHIGYQTFADCQELTDVTCLADTVPATSSVAFENSYPEYTTLHVPAASINSYKTTDPWSRFGKFVSIEGGSEPSTPKCGTPTISYADGTLTFGSDTEGAEFVSDITDNDIKKHYDATITLEAAYHISVYATKPGYENSGTAEATLYWVKANGTISTGINAAKMRGVVATQSDGMVTLSGLDSDEPVTFYTGDGKMVGRVKAINGTASMAVKAGEVVIARFGDSSIKMAVK